ncbi:hypothetical protein LZ30DRAFT_712067 [Colletotrichum cereale]|nr:hypothetical protein LZ30DRAFT_712067 [Colletotrichum cereale]
MGGKVWSIQEERVFWRIIVPQSQKRIGTGPAHTKTWEELAALMQSLMGVDAKRTYTHLGLFEHFFQNIDKSRISPNAGFFVREYQQAVNRIVKTNEEERAMGADLDGQSDDAAAMINVYQDNDNQAETNLSHCPGQVNDGGDQSADDFKDEDGAIKGDKENPRCDRFPTERVRSRALPHDPVPMANMGPGSEYAHGMPVQASPSAEWPVHEDIRRPRDQDPAANMASNNEVSQLQIRPSTEFSPYEGAPPRAPKRRNNHRDHPYKDVRFHRHGRNSTKGHDRVPAQASQGNSTYCAAPGSHHSSQGYYTPTGLGYHAPYYDYGYHGENFRPHLEYQNHSQRAPSHPVVFYDQAPRHFHGSYGYEPRHLMPHGSDDSRGWQLPRHSTSSMVANYDSSESRDSSWSNCNGHSHSSMEDDYVSSKNRSDSGRDCDSFIPENIQHPMSSASDSRHLILRAEERERLWEATRDKESEPFKTPDLRQV